MVDAYLVHYFLFAARWFSPSQRYIPTAICSMVNPLDFINLIENRHYLILLFGFTIDLALFNSITTLL
ncbi:unnamed protein product [Rotaria sordida]|uniref:Uncharacterized protein n=1 Tax=Rotaria sordida TaxID=392033 RepID=A0A819VSG5_9BILA|nr:unnamed protein product [Rotaria sordida]